MRPVFLYISGARKIFGWRNINQREPALLSPPIGCTAVTRGNTARMTLIETAMRLFRQRGFASVGLNLIINESGVPRGSLYHYFPNGKHALGAAAVEHAGNLMLDMLEGLASKHRSPSTFVRAYCEQMADWMAASGYQDGSPIATTILETLPGSPEIQFAAQKALEGWTDVIARALTDGTPEDKHARSRAGALIAAVEGSLIIARVQQSKRPILNIARQYRRLETAPA